VVELEVPGPAGGDWIGDVNFAGSTADMAKGSAHDKLGFTLSASFDQRVSPNRGRHIGRSQWRLPKVALSVLYQISHDVGLKLPLDLNLASQ